MLSYYLLSRWTPLSANKYIGVAEFGKYWEWLKAEGSLLFVVCWQRIDKDSDKYVDKDSDKYVDKDSDKDSDKYVDKDSDKDSDKANANFLPLS